MYYTGVLHPSCTWQPRLAAAPLGPGPVLVPSILPYIGDDLECFRARSFARSQACSQELVSCRRQRSRVEQLYSHSSRARRCRRPDRTAAHAHHAAVTQSSSSSSPAPDRLRMDLLRMYTRNDVTSRARSSSAVGRTRTDPLSLCTVCTFFHISDGYSLSLSLSLSLNLYLVCVKRCALYEWQFPSGRLLIFQLR